MQRKLSKEGGVCAQCGDTRLPTVDHIVPVSILKMFELPSNPEYEWEDNLQVLCKYCNGRKSGRIDPKHPSTYTVLRKLLHEAETYYQTKDQNL
jgi:5-methylcytosine-specific restriction endonuclease McrA